MLTNPVSLKAACRRCGHLLTALLIAGILSGVMNARGSSAAGGAFGGAALAPNWNAEFDGRVRFYQATELGVLIVGTEKSLYAVDGETGDVVWRRKNARLDETDVAPVPGTDLLLVNLEKGDRTRMEAVDLFTGDPVWQSERVRGAVMQMAVDTNRNLLAVVFARNVRKRPGEEVKRRPIVHVFDLSAGRELWKHELDSEVEMMPTRFVSDKEEEVSYTLDNYHPPAFVDNRLYVFYEGVTSLDAQSGKERLRQRFRVNEENLALTEADPIFDEQFIYTSGRGRVRAVSRLTGKEEWEAKDLGLTPEMVLAGGVLYVRTGGRFTNLRTGETIERGPYGVSALDPQTGRALWRYKGADKGITNIALLDEATIVVADQDDLITIDADTGKRRGRVSHDIERAAFVVINEPGHAVVGGQNEIAAFDIKTSGELTMDRSVWRARHTPPGRGVLRTVAAIAARATSLYFRYGSAATTVFRGAQLAQAARSTLRWSGLTSRVSLPNLTSLATNSARDYVTARFTPFGIARRYQGAADSIQRGRPQLPSVRVPSVAERSSVDVEERLLDRLDPARQLDRLSKFLLRRRRLATLRGNWMYFYTNLSKQNSSTGNIGGRGLAGVNINTGRTERLLRVSDPDDRFIADDALGLFYFSEEDRLLAYRVE